MSYLVLDDSYKFAWSADDVSYTDITSVENKGYKAVGTGYYSYELCVNNIPENAKYIRVSMTSPQASSGWKYCIYKASYNFYAKQPSLELKTADGVTLLSGAVTDKNVVLSKTNLKDEQVVIKKDGQPYALPAGSLFNIPSTPFIFSNISKKLIL